MVAESITRPTATMWHESGHAIAAVLVGWNVKHVAVDGARGICTVRTSALPKINELIKSNPALQEVMAADSVNEALRCLAGGVAECLAMDEAFNPALIDDLDIVDISDAHTAIEGLFPDRSARSAFLLRLVEALADKLLEPGCWRALLLCANALAEGVTDGAVLEGLIRRALPDAPTRPVHRVAL